MSSIHQNLHAYADLFCGLYDRLDRVAVRERGSDWLHDRNVGSLIDQFASDVELGRPLAAFEMRLNSYPPGADVERRIYAALAGIDTAFRHVHPMAVVRAVGGEPTPQALVELQAHVAASGRLDSPSGANGGALLPRLVEPPRRPGEPDDKRDLFHYVVRVQAASWNECDYMRLPEDGLLLSHEVHAGLNLACVPVIADAAEMRFERHPGAATYRIAPIDAAVTLERIEAIVARLDAEDVQIAVAPELTLTPALLARWQAVLGAPRRTRLRWVLAGSGPLETRGARPINTAVLLEGRTGRVLARQDKQHGFDMTDDELRRFGLEGLLGPGPVSEDVARGHRLTILDAGAERVAVLVCEDLARVVELGGVLRDFGVSLLLVPVLSRPLREYRWEHRSASIHGRTIGASVVIANSLVVHGLTGDPGGTAMVIPANGQVLVGTAADPAEPVCFRLAADGTAAVR